MGKNAKDDVAAVGSDFVTHTETSSFIINY